MTLRRKDTPEPSSFEEAELAVFEEKPCHVAQEEYSRVVRATIAGKAWITRIAGVIVELEADYCNIVAVTPVIGDSVVGTGRGLDQRSRADAV